MTAEPGINYRWLRRIRATFTGLNLATDSVTFTGAGKTSIYETTGRQDGLRISAAIIKAVNGLPGASNIMLYNLSPETRGAFVRNQTMVKIEAGWDQGSNSGIQKAFSGHVLSAGHSRAGADIVTTVRATSGIDDLMQEEERKTWKQGYPVWDIVMELAGKLPGVTVDPAKIKDIDMVVGRKGWSWAGSVIPALAALGREYGFSWTVIDDVFQAVKDGKSNFGICATLKEPYLIEVNAVLAGPLQLATGIQAKCAFNPLIMPGFNIQINSALAKKFNGADYRVASVTHNLDCFASNSFTTNVMAFMPPSSRSL
jgi:hypothetical protein